MPNLIDPVALTQALVRCPSITPADAGALGVMEDALTPLGFDIHRLRFAEEGTAPIDNIFARLGTEGPHLCYMGHTDVVPTGPLEKWTYPPFAADIADGKLYGRGVADMKGGNAAFAAAVSRFLHEKGATFKGSISLLLTGDEEASAINGSVKVIGWMRDHNQIPDVALVGEPGNFTRMGEIMRVGRRGSLNGRVTVKGIQGHSAYPERADNPVPKLVRLLSRLMDETFDAGSDDFPPTNLVISSVDVGNTAPNVIPGEATALLNIRFNDLWTSSTLEQKIRSVLDSVGLAYHLAVWCNAESFVTPKNEWRDLVASAVQKVSGTYPHGDTGGGTSDARFMAPFCPVVEYGLINATIHKIDEHVLVKDIEELTKTYYEILKAYFLK